MTKCLACGKPLKLIGVERKNGKGYYKDWTTREYHKQCYLKIKKEENSFNYIYKGQSPLIGVTSSKTDGCLGL
jgi:hypothetical protein